MVVATDGTAYVGNFGFRIFPTREEPKPAAIAKITSSGAASVAAAGLWFPNGMVISGDGHTLVVAESAARRLSAFDIAEDGSLINQRLWGQMAPDQLPDGLCLDADGAIWIASPPSKEVVPRSFGPVRARHYGGDQLYHEIANDAILVLPQIETREAVDNIGAILAVPGISGIYVGPGDLSLSLCLKPTLDREEPEILEIYRRLLKEAATRGLTAGIQNATAAYAIRMAELGLTFLTVGSDLGFLASGARDSVQNFRNPAGIIPGRS